MSNTSTEKDIGDMVFDHWKLAMHQAAGDPEGMVSILATAVSFAAVEGGIEIGEVLSRIKDDYETGLLAHAQAMHDEPSSDP